MTLTYYLNKSDKRYVTKDIVQLALQDHSNPVNIVMLDDTTITHPTFKMKDVDLYMTSNYVYVDTLLRYYFIDSVEVSKGYAYLHCTCDVLTTYARGLKTQRCIIRRQEYTHDAMQNDGQLPVKQYPAKRCIGQFDTPFHMTTNKYIMGVVGKTSGGNT